MAWCAVAILASRTAWADETCRYSGTSSYGGRLSIETRATTANSETTVNAAARVNARSFGLIDWQYLYQEIGIFRAGELQTIGVNHRYSVLGSIRRQLWDVFRRTSDGMQGWRVEANTLPDFRRRHPGFVGHWPEDAFGEDWLPNYPAAPPDRRADLDLPQSEMAPDLGTPLLLAFYWVRWAGDQPRTVPVFLPGFKHNLRAGIRLVSLGVESGGLLHLHASVRHPQLSATKTSVGDAWISPDHHLVRVTFEARADYGSAHGEVHLDGCEGQPPAP